MSTTTALILTAAILVNGLAYLFIGLLLGWISRDDATEPPTPERKP